jgi:hypothetical protein
VQIKADICAVASRLRDFEEFGSVVLMMSLLPRWTSRGMVGEKCGLEDSESSLANQ